MNFLLYKNKNSVQSNDLIKKNKNSISNPIVYELNNDLKLIIENKNLDSCLVNNKYILGFINGYARCNSLKKVQNENIHHEKIFENILNDEYIGNKDITGNFSCIIYDKIKNKLCLFNDFIGAYPIYYDITSTSLASSSSLNIMSNTLNKGVDHTGVVESIMTWDSDFCFGSRTILNDTKRLLPGEIIFVDAKLNKILNKKYDNTFDDNPNDNPNDNCKDISNQLVSIIKEELEICFLDNEDIILPLSGGLDSRLILGAMDKSKNVLCVNYGDPDDYETKIAKRCANVSGFNFKSYNSYPYIFPDIKILEKYIIKTEAVMINAWLSIFENLSKTLKGNISIIGDIFDLFTLKHGSIVSRYDRSLYFIKSIFGMKTEINKKFSAENYELWKKQKIKDYIKKINKIKYFQKIENKDFVIKEIKSDISDLMNRVESQNIYWMENVYELYSLFTWGRNAMFNQLLLSKIMFRPLMPIGSLKLFRFASKVKPSYKMNFGLFDEVFKNKIYNDLNEIPTAAIPIIGNKHRNNLKMLVWVFRFSIDYLLNGMKILFKSKKIPRRILKTFDYQKCYNKESKKLILSYFSTDNIYEKDRCLSLNNNREKMNSTPLVNFDIMKLAKLNIQIGKIKKR